MIKEAEEKREKTKDILDNITLFRERFK